MAGLFDLPPTRLFRNVICEFEYFDSASILLVVINVLIKNLKSALPQLLLAAVLSLSIFGVFFCTDIMMDLGGTSMTMNSDCHGMDQMGCPMGIDVHLTAWSNLLKATLADALFGLIFLALFVCAQLIGVIKFFAPTKNHYREYLLRHQKFKLYNYFTALFAAGIIQPKIFA